MNTIDYTYVVYLGISVALTLWVGRTLHRGGRVFLVDVFKGNAELADSVNRLLLMPLELLLSKTVKRTPSNRASPSNVVSHK